MGVERLAKMSIIEERLAYSLARGKDLRRRRTLIDYTLMCVVTAGCLLAATQVVVPLHHVSFAGLVAAPLITRFVASPRAARMPAAIAIGYAVYSLVSVGELDSLGEWIWFGLIATPVGLSAW